MAPQLAFEKRKKINKFSGGIGIGARYDWD
jgi:hypothetical protein